MRERKKKTRTIKKLITEQESIDSFELFKLNLKARHERRILLKYSFESNDIRINEMEQY